MMPLATLLDSEAGFAAPPAAKSHDRMPVPAEEPPRSLPYRKVRGTLRGPTA